MVCGVCAANCALNEIVEQKRRTFFFVNEPCTGAGNAAANSVLEQFGRKIPGIRRLLIKLVSTQIRKGLQSILQLFLSTQFTTVLQTVDQMSVRLLQIAKACTGLQER